MKKTMRKRLSGLLLAVILLFTSIPTTALAETGIFDAGESSAGVQASLTFDENYTCGYGETVAVSATYVSENAPEDIIWECSDPDAVSFSGTSVLGPAPEENTYYISVMVTGLKTGSYELTLSVSGEFTSSVKLTITDVLSVGILQSVDTASGAINIDGTTYQAAASCNINDAADVLNSTDSKKVVYSMAEGKIAKIQSVFDVIAPVFSIKAVPDSFVYQNGGYNTDSISVNVTVTCSVSKNSLFSAASLSGVDGLSMELKEFTLKIDSDGLNFGTTGTLFKKEITETTSKAIEIVYGKSKTYTYDVYISDGYVPDNAATRVEISGKALLNNKESEINCNSVYVSIGNLDLQREQKKTDLQYSQQLGTTKAQLDKVTNGTSSTAIALDANLSCYFSSEQQKEIEEFLSIYISAILNAEAIQDDNSNIFQKLIKKLPDKIKDKVRDKILKKLGVSVHAFLWTKSLNASVDVSGTSLDGETVTVTFDISIDNYSTGEYNSDAYAALCTVDYTIKDKDSVPAGASQSGKGVVTWVNMQNFASSVVDFLEIAYNEAWGNKADKVASMIVSEPFDKLMGGKYAGKLYKLMTKPTKNSTKKVSMHCPVDVYVYDRNGNLCGTIKDGCVDQITQDIFLVANGDDKYVYLAGDSYDIKLISTASGTMKYKIEEYEDSQLVRTVTTNNVPLEIGLDYESYIPDILYIDNDVYELTTDIDESLEVDSDSYNKENSELEDPRIIERGYCGDNAIWTFYSDGLLEITGTGPVDDLNGMASSMWWHYHSQIKYIVVRNGITSIGKWAFGWDYNHTHSHIEMDQLKSIEIGDSVTSIGDYAFYNSPSLKSISIGAGVQKIGNYAFSYCNSLEYFHVDERNQYFTSEDNILYSKDKKIIYRYPHNGIQDLVIPEGVTTLYLDSFGDMDSVITVEFPKTVLSLRYDTFDGCDNILTFFGYSPSNVEYYAQKNNIEFISLGDADYCGSQVNWRVTEDGILTIDGNGRIFDFTDSAYSRSPWYYVADSIESIEIGDGVTGIGKYSFSYCTNVTDVVIPDGVDYIGQEAFYKCNSLKAINIPEGVSEIPQSAFYNCSSLESVQLPNSITDIGSFAFYGCSSLKTINIPEGVIEISQSAFYGCKSLESIELPESIKSIGSSAFYGCSSLKTINIPKGIIEIPNNAFYNCSSLESVQLPESIKSIGSSAFYECSYLKAINIPEGVIEISQRAFYGCRSLESIELPESITGIGSSVFEECIRLKSVNIPEGIIEIPQSAFYYCMSLESIELPENITSIGSFAFCRCSRLKAIELPENITSIGSSAFSRCSSLKEVVIPGSVNEIGQSAFVGCTQLENITVDDSNAMYCSVNGILYSKDQSVLILYPQNKESVFTVPDMVTEIDYAAFMDCKNLIKIVISENVSKINISAFNGCSGLKRVIFAGDAPVFSETGKDYYTIFKDVTAEVYYPADNETWTEDVLQNYGGTLTWIPYGEMLKITSQPSDYTGEVGDTAVFTVEASGDNLTYQWQYQNVGSTVWKASGQNGNNTNTLSIPIMAARDGQKYRCIITDEIGEQVISDESVLRVEKQAEELRIVSQPVDYTGEVGDTAVFTVESSGESLTYQWQYQNAGSSVWKASGQSGNKTSSISVPITTARNGQKYRCVVTDGSGNQATSNAATLHVGSTSGSKGITITGQPSDYTGFVGETAAFSVTAEGTGLSYQWQYQNVGNSVWKASGQSGNKTGTLSVPITEARDGQKYRCVITDGAGNQVTSETATLYVRSTSGTEEITIKSQPVDYTGAEGGTAIFIVAAEGEKLSYQWQYQNAGSIVWKASGQNGNQTDTLKVPITKGRNGQKYRCVVTDKNGNQVISDEAALYVSDKSVIVYDVNSFDTYRDRTIEEVAGKYSDALNAGESYINKDSSSYYIEQPSKENPYAEGVLTEDTHAVMTEMTNFYRWLVGSENLQKKSVHSEELQLGALVRYFDFNHSVNSANKPEDMSDEMWSRGAACGHNIIARGYTPKGAIIEWINEGYDLRYEEWDTIGHRFHLIAPNLSSVQFGYSVGVAIGDAAERNNGKGKEVVSPFPAAGYMPNDLVYPRECAWTVSFDTSVIKNDSSSNVTVEITNLTTGNVYIRSASDKTVKLYSDAVAFVQPDDYSTDTGAYEDSYQVVLSGLTDVNTGKEAQIRYVVNFVDVLPHVSSTVSSVKYSLYNIHTSGGSAENLKKLASILPQEVTVTAENGYTFTVPVSGKWELDQENNCWKNHVDASALPDNITDSRKVLDNIIMKYSLTDNEYAYYNDLTISPSKVNEGEGGRMLVYRSNISTDTSRIFKITQDSDGSYSSVVKYDSNSSPEFDPKGSSDLYPFHVYKINAYSAKDSGEYVSVYYRSSDSGYIYVSRNIATLTVKSLITLQPQDYAGEIGETAVFKIGTDAEGISFQWQYQNVGSTVWKTSGQSGNKTDTLSVPITAARNGQKYRCVVTDAYGNEIISEEAVLSVKQ